MGRHRSYTLSRRRFLALGATVAGGTLLLQACGPAAPTPTPIPAKPIQPQPMPTPVPEKPAAKQPETPSTPTPVPKPMVLTPTPRAAVPRQRTLIVGFEGGPVQAPEMANPYVPGARINQGYHQLMIESLYYLNYETGQLIPWLAEGHEYNADYTQVDIKLRGGVTWADGKPFTPEDVAFTLNLLKENPGLAYGPEMNRFVQEVTVTGPYTVRVKLKEPYPRFIFNNFTVHIWGAVRILPKHIWEGQDPMKFTNFDLSKGWPIFTGPYRLVKASSTEFVYDRRDDWWGARTGFKNLPAPERVVFVEAGTDDKKAAALEANDVDGQPSLSIEAMLKVREKNPKVIGWMDQPPYTWIDPCPGMLGFNCQLAPWDDPEMRWAVNLAIDREKLKQAYAGGFGMPARYNFPLYAPLEALLNENNDLFTKYNVLEYNPRKAMQIIESKGYRRGADGIYAKDGKPLKVNILVKAGALTSPIVSLLVAFLKNIGIDAAPQGLAETQFFDRRNRGDFEIETTHVACGSTVDPFGELNLFHSQWIRPKGEIRSANQWGYRNPEYDALVDKIRLLPPGDPRIKPLFRQALEIRLRDLPIIPLLQQFRVVPYNTTYWTNWPTQKNNYFHPPNWWMSFLMLVMNIKPTAG